MVDAAETSFRDEHRMPPGMRFEPPVPSRDHVERARLWDKLRGRFTHPLTVVVAPAGMGKTTVLAQAVAADRGATGRVDVWFTCRPSDATRTGLVEGLCRAMDAPAPAGTDDPVEVLVDELWRRSPVDVCLVLDDVHELPDGSAGAALLAALIDALPANGHLLLAGRRPPPVPTARRQVEGEIVRVGEADLLFTSDEIEAFAARRRVAPERLAAWGGWPALSELAAAAPDVESAYIWEEVLDRLPPRRRHELALLAHVGPFDDDLAGAVLDRTVAVAELTADLPLVATTATGGRRIHPLWQPHLARIVDDGAIREARRRAGVWHAAADDPAAALRELAAAEAWNDLAAVVIGALGAAHPPVAADVVASWSAHLPDHLARGPLGRLLGAVVAAQETPSVAIAELHATAEDFRLKGDLDGELACMAQVGHVAWWAEDPALLAGLVARLFELEAAGHEGAMPLACVSRALIADLTADSRQVLQELHRVPPGRLHSSWQSVVEWLRAMALHHLGRPAEALAAATLGASTAGPQLRPVIESTRLQALWYLGDTGPVVEGLPRLADWAVGAGLRDNAALLAAGAATAYAAVGRTDDAERYLELARRSTTAPDAPLVDAYLTVAGAASAVSRGDDAAAARALDDYLGRSAPIDTGVAASAHRRSLSLWYVLVPATREIWDAADLGPCYAQARELARALVAVREHPRARPVLPELDDLPLVRALLPARWTVELALAYVADDRPEGWTLLEAMWPEARDEVRRHAGLDGPGAKAARAVLTRLPVPPAGVLEVRLLGAVLELSRDGELIDPPEWRRARVRSLLAYLVLNRPASRERVADALWPELETEAQSRNLRVTLSHLLRLLEPERGDRDASYLLRSHGSGLLLHDDDWIDVDLWRFDRAWDRASAAERDGRPSEALDALLEAVELWRASPGELALNEWAQPAVEECRVRLVEMACRAGELLLARRRHDDARRVAEVALDEDPWCDRAHRLVIAALEDAGHERAAHAARLRYQRAQDEIGH